MCRLPEIHKAHHPTLHRLQKPLSALCGAILPHGAHLPATQRSRWALLAPDCCPFYHPKCPPLTFHIKSITPNVQVTELPQSSSIFLNLPQSSSTYLNFPYLPLRDLARDTGSFTCARWSTAGTTWCEKPAYPLQVSLVLDHLDQSAFKEDSFPERMIKARPRQVP